MSEPTYQDLPMQAADTGTAPSLGFRFPFELQKIIFKCLKKYELKQVRLVSKTCRSLVTPLLFDRVYISLKQLDLEVFAHCAAHPVISSTIEEIIYDASQFDPNMTRQDYCSQLGQGIPREVFWNPSHPYQHFANEYFARDRNRMDVCRNHQNDAFVIEGYQVWQSHAWHERYAMESGRFFNTLHLGLRNFSRLSSIVVTNELFSKNVNDASKLDRETLQCKYPGSPVTRSWKPLHACPTSEDTDEYLIAHFLKLTSALSSSGVHLRKLDLCGQDFRGLPLSIFQAAKRHCSALLQDSFDAYRDLENLSLKVQAKREDDYVSRTALGMLPDLLGEMQWLKNLDLCLYTHHPMTDSDHDSYFTYDQVFPRYAKWKHLVRLDIAALSIKGVDLFDLLLLQMPNIRKLSLFDINLLQGAWEGVIEALRGAKLTDFTLRHSNLMYQTKSILVYGPAYTDRNDSLQADFIEAIEYYVLYGGRHPCLPPDVEPRAAQGYCWSLASEETMEKLIAGPKSMAQLVRLTQARRHVSFLA